MKSYNKFFVILSVALAISAAVLILIFSINIEIWINLANGDSKKVYQIYSMVLMEEVLDDGIKPEMKRLDLQKDDSQIIKFKVDKNCFGIKQRHYSKEKSLYYKLKSYITLKEELGDVEFKKSFLLVIEELRIEAQRIDQYRPTK